MIRSSRLDGQQNDPICSPIEIKETEPKDELTHESPVCILTDWLCSQTCAEGMAVAITTRHDVYVDLMYHTLTTGWTAKIYKTDYNRKVACCGMGDTQLIALKNAYNHYLNAYNRYLTQRAEFQAAVLDKAFPSPNIQQMRKTREKKNKRFRDYYNGKMLWGPAGT